MKQLDAEGIKLVSHEPETDVPDDFKPEIRGLVQELENRKSRSIRLVPVDFGGGPVTDNPNVTLDQKRKYSLQFIEKLARYGLTESEIADVLGIEPKVLFAWQKRDRTLKYLLQRGKDEADRLVVESLFRRAMGFSWTEITSETKFEGEKETVSEKRTAKFLPPDVQAIELWLTNRKKLEWRKQVNVNETRTVKVVKELALLDDKALKELAEEGKN